MPVLLILLLCTTLPLTAQVTTGDPAVRPAISPAAAVPTAQEASQSLGTLPADSVASLHAVEGAGGAAAQPTVQGFLYHVFLTAVTALITALIWRAVF